MEVTALGRRVYSISEQSFPFLGDALFGEGAISAVMGGVIVDLVSAPMEPGEYGLRVAAAMGGGEIYLPRYAKLAIDGLSFWGGKRVHVGKDHWERMRGRLLAAGVELPEEVPPYALEAFEERPVTVRFTVNALMGGFGVYRL